MALIRAARVFETTTTTGTGAVALSSVTGYRRFSAVCATNDRVPVLIEAVDSDGLPSGDWEVSLAKYTAANELTRTLVIQSSNSGSAVSFSSGTKNVFLCDIPDLDKTYFVSGSDVTNSSNTTPSDITGLSFDAEADGIYQIDVTLVVQSAQQSNSVYLAFDTPASPTQIQGLYWMPQTTAPNIAGGHQIADAAYRSTPANVPFAAEDVLVVGRWSFINGSTAGTCKMTVRSEGSGVQVTVQGGNQSWMQVKRIG